MVFIAKKLKEITSIDDKKERQRQLEELAQKVGASTNYYASGIPSDAHPPEEELVTRIQDARRTNSIVHSSIAAIVSAVIALLSAIAAWLAVVYN